MISASQFERKSIALLTIRSVSGFGKGLNEVNSIYPMLPSIISTFGIIKLYFFLWEIYPKEDEMRSFMVGSFLKLLLVTCASRCWSLVTLRKSSFNLSVNISELVALSYHPDFRLFCNVSQIIAALSGYT